MDIDNKLERIQADTPGSVDYLELVDKEDLKRYIMDDFDSANDVFHEFQEIAAESIAFYQGRQWTAEEIRRHKLQQREPYVFNEVKNKIDHLFGTQSQTKLDTKIVGREPGDSQAATLLTALVKWVEQVNKMEFTESEVFQSGVITGCGATVVYWDMDDMMYGFPRIEQIPYNELYWDVESSLYNLEDARWMGRKCYIKKSDAIERYPEREELINDMGSYLGRSMYGNLNVGTPRQEKYGYSRPYGFTTDRGLIEHVEHYEKIKVYKYIVVDVIADIIERFDEKDEAEEYFESVLKAYADEGQVIIDETGTQLVTFQTVAVDRMVQTIILGDQVIEHNLLALPFFPYTIFFANFANGDYWGCVEDLKSPQRLVNRSFSQWDYMLGTSAKNPVTVMPSLLPRGETMEDLRREWSNTTPMFEVLRHDAINILPSQQVNPQIFNNIDFGISRMTDYSGGKNVLGFQDNAAESGAAVKYRAEQGGMSRVHVFENMKKWKMAVTEKVVWWIKNYMPASQIARIIGEDTTVSMVRLDDGLVDTLQEVRCDVTIAEAVRSQNTRERNFQQVSQLVQSMQTIPPELSMPILVELSDIPENIKTEILSMFEVYQEYVSKKAALSEEEKLKQSVQLQLQRKALKEQMEGTQQLEEGAQTLAEKEKNVIGRLKALAKEEDTVAQQTKGLQMENDAKMEVEKQIMVNEELKKAQQPVEEPLIKN